MYFQTQPRGYILPGLVVLGQTTCSKHGTIKHKTPGKAKYQAIAARLAKTAIPATPSMCFLPHGAWHLRIFTK